MSLTTRTLCCAVLALALSLLPTALARADWGGSAWQFGPNSLGPGHDDADCVFYRGQAACSGWAYWTDNQWARVVASGSPSFQYLVGYENSTVIRGSWAYNSTIYMDVLPSSVNMGGYLKAHITYWSGTVSNEVAWAYN